MKPTPEQVDAAKAWTRSTPNSPITAEQHAALVAYVEANKGTPGLWQWSDAPAFILLAALEAAEADSARLEAALQRIYDSRLYLGFTPACHRENNVPSLLAWKKRTLEITEAALAARKEDRT